MSKSLNPRGRVDIVAERAFDVLLARHGNPALQLARVAFGKQISEVFEENLGPGSKAHQAAQKLLSGIEGARCK